MENTKYWRKGNDITQADTKPGNGWKEITKEEYDTFCEKINQLAELKWQLSHTDYKAIKYAEGCYTEEEYAPIKAAREELRVQIRQLESSL